MHNAISPTPEPATSDEEAGPVRCRRIARHHAKAIAELERRVYPDTMRAGSRALRADLESAEWEDSNLSYGLFDGDELVGVMLVYYEVDSRHIFSYFGLPCPSDLSAEECLYIADFVVRREYSRHTLRLVKEVCTNLGPSYEQLPIYGFSTAEILERWQTRRGAARRAGLRYVGKRRFEIAQAPHEIFLVRFEVRRERRLMDFGELAVKVVTTQVGWKALEPYWDLLLKETPGGTAFQSYDLQRLWWRHFKEDGWPLVLVVYQGAKVRAIAPFWIQSAPYFRMPRRVLKFIGEHTEIDRPTILRRGEDREAVEAIFNHLGESCTLWDSMSLYEQPKEGTVISTARAFCKQHSLLVGIVPGPPCPWVDLRGSWAAFLAEKSGNLRKNLKRRLKQLQAQGTVEFKTYDTWPELIEGFEVYLQVEARSWKPQRKLGIAKNKRSLDYHTALLYEFGPRHRFHIRTLSLAGKPIAATLGLLADGRFLSLHIAHDLEHGRFSPGVLLTAYELEQGYARDDYLEYEFLGGFLENKLSWTPNLRETQQLYIYRPDPLFRMHHLWHFHMEPMLKKTLRRCGLLRWAVALKTFVRRKILRRNDAADD